MRYGAQASILTTHPPPSPPGPPAQIPREMGQLAELQCLSMFKNKLKSIPSELGQLHSCTHLSLYENRLHTVPAELGQLQNLQEL